MKIVPALFDGLLSAVWGMRYAAWQHNISSNCWVSLVTLRPRLCGGVTLTRHAMFATYIYIVSVVSALKLLYSIVRIISYFDYPPPPDCGVIPALYTQTRKWKIYGTCYEYEYHTRYECLLLLQMHHIMVTLQSSTDSYFFDPQNSQRDIFCGHVREDKVLL